MAAKKAASSDESDGEYLEKGEQFVSHLFMFTYFFHSAISIYFISYS